MQLAASAAPSHTRRHCLGGQGRSSADGWALATKASWLQLCHDIGASTRARCVRVLKAACCLSCRRAPLASGGVCILVRAVKAAPPTR